MVERSGVDRLKVREDDTCERGGFVLQGNERAPIEKLPRLSDSDPPRPGEKINETSMGELAACFASRLDVGPQVAVLVVLRPLTDALHDVAIVEGVGTIPFGGLSPASTAINAGHAVE